MFAQTFGELSPPFPYQSSAGHANHIQGSLYFSFLPEKQRDFPGNVRLGGCDSLPPVVAFTSKQGDSLLSYALHFLRIISHRMCCAGEREERRTPQSAEKGIRAQPAARQTDRQTENMRLRLLIILGQGWTPQLPDGSQVQP